MAPFILTDQWLADACETNLIHRSHLQQSSENQPLSPLALPWDWWTRPPGHVCTGAVGGERESRPAVANFGSFQTKENYHPESYNQCIPITISYSKRVGYNFRLGLPYSRDHILSIIIFSETTVFTVNNIIRMLKSKVYSCIVLSNQFRHWAIVVSKMIL